MIFRTLSEKIKQQAARDASHFSAGPQASEARQGKEDLEKSRRSSGNVTSQSVRAPPFTTGVSDKGQQGTGDELVRDPRHLREDEDEGA